jgi:hypothetical protein
VKFPLRLHNRNYYYYFSAKFGVRRGQGGQKWHFLIEKLFLAFSGARVTTFYYTVEKHIDRYDPIYLFLTKFSS